MNESSVLIVEDEILIAETIKFYLQEKGCRVTDIVVSYEEAISSIKKQKPDLVLLDVRLYGQKSGIDVAKYILNNQLEVSYVFLTSQYDSRILENALETNPAGYLTKPLQKETLWTTIELAIRAQRKKQADNLKIQLHDGNKSHLVKVDDIAYLYADHVYVNVVLKDVSEIVIRHSLSHMMSLLLSKQFVQCHRSYIVNLKMVEKYDTHNVFIKGAKIPISRSRKNTLLALLS